MEGSFDWSVVVLLLGLSSLIIGYYGAIHPVPPIRHTDISVIQLPAAWNSQATSPCLLRVRRKIPARKALQGQKDEEADSLRFHENDQTMLMNTRRNWRNGFDISTYHKAFVHWFILVSQYDIRLGPRHYSADPAGQGAAISF
ncbi:hypothetical protein [Paenibacillus sedimenti]|uniref:Uncharacterized protein n=1 Tax=Paenibacillus sedimenti TaxID=2770274 RepID=A0A926QIY7_9BACL|nr:hypothetical protein [Paenibacillus sedimenti]MBD0381010.1 hypothetical protein [Paenibacillus sedimenti]